MKLSSALIVIVILFGIATIINIIGYHNHYIQEKVHTVTKIQYVDKPTIKTVKICDATVEKQKLIQKASDQCGWDGIKNFEIDSKGNPKFACDN